MHVGELNSPCFAGNTVTPASALLAPVPTVLGPSSVSALLALSSLTVDTIVLVSVARNISKCLFQRLQFNLASINHEGNIGPTGKSYPSLPVRTQADGLEAEGLPYQVFQPSENDLCHSKKRTLIQSNGWSLPILPDTGSRWKFVSKTHAHTQEVS